MSASKATTKRATTKRATTKRATTKRATTKKASKYIPWNVKFALCEENLHRTLWEATMSDGSTVYVLANTLDKAAALVRKHSIGVEITKLYDTHKVVWTE